MTHITLQTVLACTGAALSIGVAIGGLAIAPRRGVHRLFAMVMTCLASMQLGASWSWQSIHGEYLWILASACLPSLGLLFSLSFARFEPWTHVREWRWTILIAFAVLIGFALVQPKPSKLNWSWYGFFLLILSGAVVTIAHLEKTLRASAGRIRSQIKFVVLGIGSVFAAQVYTASQALLLGVRPTSFATIEASAVILANVLILAAWSRRRQFDIRLYVARSFPFHAITFKIVMLYLLLAVGFPALFRFNPETHGILPTGVLWSGGGLVFILLVLLSDVLRYASRRVLNRYVFRTRYDYRRIWLLYTQRMASIVDPRELCHVIARLVSDTFGVPAVTVWLFPTGVQDRFVIGGSTVCWDRKNLPDGWGNALQSLMTVMLPHTMPIDFASPLQLRSGLPHCPQEALHALCVRYGTVLVSGQQVLGMITLNERLTREPFVAEDFDLLKTIADQAAASVQNAQLSQHLLEMRQMDAFQTVSTFFVHDLKNLAAKLSLMVQNLPVHYDNPEFRNDMLQVISKSVTKMNAMCSRLTLFTHVVHLNPTETDINVLIRETVTELEGTSNVKWHQELLPLPPIQVDREQIKKVIGNLLLNAIEATNQSGEIRLTSAWVDPWVVITVSDNGCGMSQEFLADKLFEPFQTTKSQGLGVGLFHSKKIIESHHGRIEADSIEGRGSIFRVLLPLTNGILEDVSHLLTPDVPIEISHE